MAATLAMPFMLFAQQADTMKVELKDVVITATKTEKLVSETGRSISVITKDQIQNSTCGTVAELLSRQEGIYIVGNGQTPGANQSIFMRGANSNQTAVLIDGVRINDASTINNTIDLSELMLVDVARIEIARGSQGTLYGSAAIGGVINIITSKNLKEGFSTDLALQGGTFGASTFSGEVSLLETWKSKDGIYVKGMYDQLHVNGLDATVDTVTDPNVFKNRDQDGWDKQSAGITGGFENNKWNVAASYRYLHMKTDLDLDAYRDDNNYTLDFTRHIVSQTASFNPAPNWKFSLSSSYSGTERITLNDSSVIDADGHTDRRYSKDDYAGKNISVDAQANYRMKGIEIIGGYSLAEEQMSQESYSYSQFGPYAFSIGSPDPTAKLNSYFIQADLNGILFGDKLSRFGLIAGTRLYSHTFFDSRYTYEINPSVKIGTNSLLYLSLSTGYNAPSLYQLYAPFTYYTWDAGYTTGLTLGNKSLKPETSKSIEIGIKQELFKIFQLQLSVFKTETSHMIDYVLLWDKNISIDELGSDFNRDDFRGDRYLNVGTQTSEGFEVSLSGPITKKISFLANFSYIKGDLKVSPSELDTAETGGNHVQLFSNGNFITGNQTVEGLVRRPSTANIQLNYALLTKLNLSITWQWADSRSDVYYDYYVAPGGALNSREIEAYSLWGFQASYFFNTKFAVRFRMENIFDKKYAEIAGYTTRGRGEYLKLTYSL